MNSLKKLSQNFFNFPFEKMEKNQDCDYILNKIQHELENIDNYDYDKAANSNYEDTICELLDNEFKKNPMIVENFLSENKNLFYKYIRKIVKTKKIDIFQRVFKICKNFDLFDEIFGIENSDKVLHLAAGDIMDDNNFKSLLISFLEKPEFLKPMIEKENEDGENLLYIVGKFKNFSKFNSILDTCDRLKISNYIITKKNKKDKNILHKMAEDECSNEIFNFLMNRLQNRERELQILLKEFDENGDTCLDIVIKLKNLTKIQSFFDTCKRVEVLKDVLCNRNRNYFNIFHHVAECKSEDTLDTLLTIFEPDLKDDLVTLLNTKSNEDKLTPIEELKKKKLDHIVDKIFLKCKDFKVKERVYDVGNHMKNNEVCIK